MTVFQTVKANSLKIHLRFSRFFRSILIWTNSFLLNFILLSITHLDGPGFTLFMVPYFLYPAENYFIPTDSSVFVIDTVLSQILTFDTSGIELYVTENNPKALNALIGKLKSYYKDKPNVDPYKMAYVLMP